MSAYVKRAPREPSIVSCGIVLTTVTLVLRVAGLRRAIAFARVLGGRHQPAVASPDAGMMYRAARRMATVGAFYPGRAECLEQSLALLVLLRRRRIPVELKIGVERRPFTAHAWVEHDGRPINESAEYVGRLTPFPSLGG